MKLERNNLVILISIYFIIVIDVLLSGIIVDILAVLVGVALYLLSRREKQLQTIFFTSAIGFFFFSIILYCINSQYLPYNSAANWAYFFFLFGVLKMLFDSNLVKTSNQEHE
jgi:hypothetical protein